MWAKCALQANKHFYKPFLSLFLFLMLGNVTLFAQQQQVHLSSKTLTAQKMMSEIEKQTGFLFVYSDVDLNIHRFFKNYFFNIFERRNAMLSFNI